MSTSVVLVNHFTNAAYQSITAHEVHKRSDQQASVVASHMYRNQNMDVLGLIMNTL
jgi:hypothetical protein